VSLLPKPFMLTFRHVGVECITQAIANQVNAEHLGQHHPDIAQTLHDLAIFYQKQGNLSEAIALIERALEILSVALGDAHPKTVATRALYTQLVQERDAFATA
jgi:tetratricopeptide (TPR) repeat protein